jgi:hypothetical protein
VIHLNSSSFADFVQSTSAVEGEAAAAPTAAPAAASETVAPQSWGKTWQPRYYRDSVSRVMLKARLSSASSQQMWLAGMTSGCGRFQRNGRQLLTAPMTACWVNGGEQACVVVFVATSDECRHKALARPIYICIATACIMW